LEKIQKFSARTLLPQNHRNYPEPDVSGPNCSTWEDSKQKKICLMKKQGQRIIEMKNVEFEATPSKSTEFVDQPGYVTKG